MSEAYDLAQELNILDPKGLRFYLDDFQDLCMEDETGEIFSPITPIRAFPLQAVNSFVVLRSAEGDEVGTLRSLSDLDTKSRKVLNTALEQAYFMPCITHVNSVKANFHVPTWDVETDRGPRVFELRSSRDVRVLDNFRIVIRDADGNRYEIPDYRQLDPASRALVETLI